MASPHRIAPRSNLLIFFLLGLLSISLLTFPMENGITPDSLSYFSAAKNLVNKGFFGDNYLYWPPLYPMLLSLHFYAGLDINTFASVLNKVLFVVMIAGLLSIGARQFSSKVLLVAVLTMAAFSEPFQLIFYYSWSETLYLPLCILTAHFWVIFLTGKNKNIYLVIACVLLALSMLTRHVGISLFGAMLLSLTASRNFQLREKAKLASFIILATVPYALWLIRTWSISGHFSGPRRVSPPYSDFLYLTDNLDKVIAHWIVPHFRFELHGLVAAIITAVVLAVIAAFSFRQIHFRCSRKEPEDSSYKSHLQLFLLIYLFCYWSLVLIAGYTYELDAPNNRILSPSYWPLLILLVSSFEYARNYLEVNGHKRSKRAIDYFGLAYAVMWISAPNVLTDLVIKCVV